MLNRSAIVVKPRQPFLDWLHSADPTCRWFDFQNHSMLVDLCDEPLIDELD
jgi:hypothetical protein